MQIDQALRRLAWRFRRRIRGAADNDPIVTLENAAPAPRRGPGRFTWMLLLLGAALAACGLLAGGPP